MGWLSFRPKQRGGGFLTRLARDRRGNTLAIMAAMLIPVLGFSGAAIDAARLYVIRVRLQQACDAGVLAGRKAMTDTTMSTPLEPAASQQAQTFFANNFREGWFGTSARTFTPVKASAGSGNAVANAVNGTASVTVPMTIMTMFGVDPTKLQVACQAIYDLADTDVMFILDTTGSMASTPTGPGAGKGTYLRDDGINAYFSIEQNGSKIEALRQAVMLFDETMTQNKQPDTVVRYGFAPYSTVVNIGKLLPATSITSDLNYDTRVVSGTYDVSNVMAVSNVPQYACVQNGRFPASGYVGGITYTFRNGLAVANRTVAATGAAAVTFNGPVVWAANICTSVTAAAVVTRPVWTFGRYPINVNNYAALYNVATPGRVNGMTSKWRGCVEIAGSSTASSFDTDSLPSDLDPDAMPNWRPMWPEAVWWPQSTNPVLDENVSENNNYGELSTKERGDSVTCPMEAQTLKSMTANDVHAYVYNNNFRAAGNTYHDYGMAWGLRMLSTKGPFAASALPSPGRRQPAPNIIFMTDGAPVSDPDNYQMYGIEGVDGRMANSDNAQEIRNHSARFRVLCDAAKLRGITVYMIAFGTALTTDMKYCASPGQAFVAKDNAALQNAFASIAKRIAMLRVDK